MKKEIRPRALFHLKLTLSDNAYNFLNQSLKHYRLTAKDTREWPFALLHLTQSIELLLKQRLSEIHPLFIFQDIDHPQATVSLEQALDRLNVAGVVVGEKEKTNIRRAVKFRNLIVHYEFELNKFEWKKIYAQLFEFVHFFHVEHLKREMHLKIWRENHAVEARLMAYFRNNFVVYHDIEMHKDHPKEIVKAQRNTVLVSGDRRYQRIKYGDVLEWDDPQYAKDPCHDCYVLKGQYHTEGCDVEMCPKCRGQLMCCGCF